MTIATPTSTCPAADALRRIQHGSAGRAGNPQMTAVEAGNRPIRATDAKGMTGKRTFPGGAERDRTADLVIANDALSQLSYGPVPGFPHRRLPQCAARRLAKGGAPEKPQSGYACGVSSAPASLGIGCTTGIEARVSSTGTTGIDAPLSGSRTVLSCNGWAVSSVGS